MPEPRMSVERTRQENLLRATENLTARVGALTGVVETNNNAIKTLRREVNRKPDDAEIQFITGMARTQRKRHLRFAVLTSITCAVIAGVISFAVANHLSKDRCTANAKQTETLVLLLSKFDVQKSNENIQFAINKLNQEKVEC